MIVQRCRCLIATLTVVQPANKFLILLGKWRFITVFKRGRHQSVSRARWTQSMSPTQWRSITLHPTSRTYMKSLKFRCPTLSPSTHFSFHPFVFWYAARLPLLNVTVLLSGKQYKILTSSLTSFFDPKQDTLQPVIMHSINIKWFTDWAVTCISLQAINRDDESISTWKFRGSSVWANMSIQQVALILNFILYDKILLDVYMQEPKNIL